MGHIHGLIDFVISVYIVHKDKVLLIHHKKLNKWLPVGGHIELHEDPDQALMREVKEETGLKINVCSPRLKMSTPGTKFLYTPRFSNIHKIDNKHRHVTLIYFAKARSDRVRHNREEHNHIRWFTKEGLGKIKVKNSVHFYATQAMKEVGW